MNWLCRLLKCRDRDLEKLYQAWLDRYRDELMRQIDRSEELMIERIGREEELGRLRNELRQREKQVAELAHRINSWDGPN